MRCIVGLALLAGLSPPMGAQAKTTLVVSVSSAVDGTFVGNATVALVGTPWIARTDSVGRVSLANVSAGRHMLRVRALGYAEYGALVAFEPQGKAEFFVQLRPAAHELPATEVTERSVSPWLREFEERRKRGTGRYITAEEIQRSHGSDIQALLERRIGSIRVTPQRTVFSLRGVNTLQSPKCQVVVYLDGVRVPYGGIDAVPYGFLGGIEYYTPGYVPVQYRGPVPNEAGSIGCGVLLLWTGP